jgi:hypothetical protein
LADVVAEAVTGRKIERVYDKSATSVHLRTEAGEIGLIKRELRRRSTVEAGIGHLKNDGHIGRCFLKGWRGHAENVVYGLSAITSTSSLPGREICCA